MSDWTRLRLGDVATIKHGYAFEGQYFSDSGAGPVLVTPGNFKVGGGWRRGKSKYYLGPDVSGYTLGEGDLVVTMTDLSKRGDTLGYSAFVPSGGPFLHNQRIGLVRVTDPGLLYDRFLGYLMRSPGYRNHVLATATGSTVRHTSPSRILDYTVAVPQLSTQHAIADVLDAFDDKIRANQDCALLEDSLAMALFAEATSGDLSPTMALSQLASVVLGGTPDRKVPEYWVNGTIGWINSGKANDFRVIEPSEWITEDALRLSAAKLMPSGATVIAITGATLGQVSRLEVRTSGNQSLVGVWAEEEALNDWLYFWIRSHRQELTKHATGGAQQHINKRVVEGLAVAFPRGDQLFQWHVLVRPLLEHTAALLRENERLTRFRDALLPRLLTGELSVRDGGAMEGDLE